jgi:hypothetical protein
MLIVVIQQKGCPTEAEILRHRRGLKRMAGTEVWIMSELRKPKDFLFY